MSDYPSRCTRLDEYLGELGNLLVAVSGGVDSAVLLHAAHRVLGDHAVGLVANSPSLPRRDLEELRDLARDLGVRIVEANTDEFERPGYVSNDGLRCYHCKQALFDAMDHWAEVLGMEHRAFGAILDDAADDRPGARAARERQILAPLVAAGFTKVDVRCYAREHKLSLADKPASACLASRIPLGTAVRVQSLERVEAAERDLHDHGIRVVRVRDHTPLARVEVGQEFLGLAQEKRFQLEQLVRLHGFSRVELSTYVPPAERPR